MNFFFATFPLTMLLFAIYSIGIRKRKLHRKLFPVRMAIIAYLFTMHMIRILGHYTS